MSLNRSSKLLAGVAAVLLGAAASLVTAAPAQAVTGLIVTIDWSDLTGSESFKTANAVCPAGKVLLGGGADIVDGGALVHLSSMIPAAAGYPTHSYYAVARESAAFAGNWTMYSWAICGSGVTGWQVVSGSYTASSGTNVVGVHLSCPSGKKVIGTGAAAVGGGHFLIRSIVPSADLTELSVEVGGDEVASGAYSAYAYAICVNPVAGQQRVSATTAANSISKGISVACPAGKKLHGTGGDHTAGGEAHFDRIGLWGPGAVSGSDVAVIEDATGFAENWTATAYAICAT